jgi:hypothetical protein
MNPWPPERIIKWLEQALVGAAIVRKNMVIGWGEIKLREVKL